MDFMNRAIAVAIVLWPITALAVSITSEEAPSHVGETVTVCGTVTSANCAARTRGEPTFLNLDKPYPNQIFTAVIWGSDRPKFGTPESLSGKSIWTTGVIKLYRGRPEIILHDPSQLVQK
jgi:DNA/RNA endonuclease YhcR with UshA esterase domain